MATGTGQKSRGPPFFSFLEMEILFVSRFLESRANNNNLNGDFDFELKKKKESKHDNDEREAFLLFGNESFIIYININIKKKLLE